MCAISDFLLVNEKTVEWCERTLTDFTHVANTKKNIKTNTMVKVLSHHSTVFSFSNKKSDIAHIEPMIIEE